MRKTEEKNSWASIFSKKNHDKWINAYLLRLQHSTTKILKSISFFTRISNNGFDWRKILKKLSYLAIFKRRNEEFLIFFFFLHMNDITFKSNVQLIFLSLKVSMRVKYSQVVVAFFMYSHAYDVLAETLRIVAHQCYCCRSRSRSRIIVSVCDISFAFNGIAYVTKRATRDQFPFFFF